MMIGDKVPQFIPQLKRLAIACQALILLSLCFSAARRVFPQARPLQLRSNNQAHRRAGYRATRKRIALKLRRLSGRFLSFQQQEATEKGMVERQEDRLDWFLLQRTYPHPFFNLSPLIRSYELEATKLEEFLDKLNLIQLPSLVTPHW